MGIGFQFVCRLGSVLGAVGLMIRGGMRYGWLECIGAMLVTADRDKYLAFRAVFTDPSEAIRHTSPVLAIGRFVLVRHVARSKHRL